MKLVCISDTHTRHREINMPEGDILICSGDITFRGELDVIEDFADWLKYLPYKHKLIVFGNHEVGIEKGPKRPKAIEFIKNSGSIYLEDSGVEINGIKFWGSPITPFFCNWEWNRHRGKDINHHWKLIPDDTNVLITHGPVYGILDEAPRGVASYSHVGCEDLLNRIWELKDLKIHCCGHIHDGYSIKPKEVEGIKFINASICDERYHPSNSPIVIDL